MTVYPNYQLPCGSVLPALPSRVTSVYAWLERWHRQTGRLVFCTGYLAGKMNVSERTAYSWLEKMRSAGYIHCDRVGRERHITPLARPLFLRGRASGVHHESFSDSAPIPPIVFTQDAYTHNAQQTDTTDTTASEASPVVVSKDERECPGSSKAVAVLKVPVLGGDASKPAASTLATIPKPPQSATDHNSVVAELVACDIPQPTAAQIAAQWTQEQIRPLFAEYERQKGGIRCAAAWFRGVLRNGGIQSPGKNGTPASLGILSRNTGDSEEWDRARARHLGAIPETEYPQLRTRAERYLREVKGLRYFSMDTLAQMMGKAWENQMKGTVRA